MANLNQSIKWQGMRAVLCAMMLTAGTAAFAQDDAEGQAPEQAPKRVVRAVKQYPTVTLSGNVVDLGTKEPLAGVQIQALGNKTYTAMTDENGAFTIKVPKFVTALYVFSPEYMSQQVAINPADSTASIDIRMMSDHFTTMYDEKTHYTASKQATLGGHYATPDGGIAQQFNGDLRSITRSGVVESGSAMFIRGLNSLNANAQPLIVIDGIEQDMMLDRTALHEGQFLNQLANLSPSDIESVEVLKNATALYGSRGANGVILINTKRGHSMATRIDADIYAGIQTIPTLPNMMDANQYRTYATEMLGTIPAVLDYRGTLSMNFLNDDPNGFYYHTYHNNTDWTKPIYRNAVTQNYNVNVQGGDDVGMYNLSVGYMRAENTVKQNDFDRFNIRFNTDIEIIPSLKTVFNLSISRATSKVLDTAIPADLTQGTITSPTFLALIKSPLVAPYKYNPYTGGASSILSDYDDIYSQLDNVERGLGTAQSLANPVAILANGSGEHKNRAENTNFNITLAPTWEINKHLKLTEQLAYTLVRTSQRYYRPYGGVPPFQIAELGTVYARVASMQATENNFLSNTRIDWENLYGGSHYVKLFGGFRFNSFSYDSTELNVQRRNATNDKNPSLAANESNGFSSSNGAADEWKQMQWYANADYNYQNRYFATVSMLAEANSRFGAKAGAKMFGVGWAFFPSVQLGWVATNESWFPKTRYINYLRVNAGFDTSGNDNISNYAARTSFSSVRYNMNAIGSQLTNIGNDNIKWELTRKFNLGFEGNFLDNRLSVRGDLFWHSTKDLLTLKTFENPMGGINLYWTNAGALRNHGYEFTFSGKPIVTKDWNLELGATIGHYKNKITSLPDGNYTSSIYGDNNILTAVGSPAGVFYGYKTAGVYSTSDEAAQYGLYMKDATGKETYFQGGDVHFLDLYEDGVIDEKDKTIIGDPNPDIYGTIFAMLNWKRFTLNMNFNYSLGNDIYNYQRSIINSGSNFYNQQVAEIGHWRYEGQQTTMPRIAYGDPMGNNRFSDRWIEDGSFLKLKSINLTYRVPVSASSTWLQGLSVWCEAQNLFTLSKYKGSDPEFSIASGVLYQGIDAGNLAQGRRFLVGVKINL